MINELLPVGIFLVLLLLLIILTWLLYKKFHWNTEDSRKFLHVTGGILCLFIPRFISSQYSVLFLCSCAFSLLLYTFLKKQLAAVHKTTRKSYGSILFPAPIYFCFLAMTRAGNPDLYFLPVLLLTFADTSAEIAGKKWGNLWISFFNGQKTLAGSTAFFMIALGVSFLYFSTQKQIMFSPPILLMTLTISLAAAITELISLKGLDNITIPAVVLLLLYLFG